MNTPSQINPKKILANPLAAYASLTSDKPADIQSLEKLWAQLRELQQQQNETQLASKKLSRQIGEAKRNKQDIAPLKQSMQQLGQLLKQLSQQTTPLEQAILHFFELPPGAAAANKTSKDGAIEETITTRHPSESPLDISQISINQLHSEHQQWNDYVNNHPTACIHHLAEWSSLLHHSYDHQPLYLLARNKQNNIVGVLPLVRLTSRLFGDLLVSMPFFQRAGAIAEHPLIEKKLMQAANSQASQLGIDHIEYRDDIPRQAMPVQSHKVNMVLSLPTDKETLWKGFTAKLRAQINRAKREQPQVFIGSDELIDDFYAVYARNMRDLGSPLHSKNFITNILKTFPDSSWLVVLKLNNKPVAAALLLGFKQMMEIPLASTIRDVNHLSINMLLYWQVLKLAIERGYTRFDFGRSSKGAGTYRFKKQWGARAKPLYWHYWLADGKELPGLNPSNPKFALAIYLWKHLPVKLSQWIGPHIVKNIP